MKKTLIFIIFILLIVILAFPIVLAEGDFARESDNTLEPVVLSDMARYMKLSNPIAIDKTDDYLAVANEKTLFVQKQDSKYSYFYKDLTQSNDERIDKLTIVGNKIIALIIKDNNTNLCIVDTETQIKTSYQDIDYQNILSIGKKDNKLAIILANSIATYDITTDTETKENILSNKVENNLNIGIGVNSVNNIKIINNEIYVFSSTTTNTIIKKYNNATNSFVDIHTIDIGNIFTDYYVVDNQVYFIAGGKLYKNSAQNQIYNEEINFNKLVFSNNKLYVTAQNHKVYLFNNDAFENTITSKGDDIQRFDSPKSVFSDGSYLYIADTNNKRIVKRNISNKERTAFPVDYTPIKVAAVSGRIYYIDNQNNLYDDSNKLIAENVQSIAVYNTKLLVLKDGKVLTYDGSTLTELIKNISIAADEITTAVSTNYAYLINKATGYIAKYDLENTEKAVFTDTTNVAAGRNYNIDFRGNLYVEKDGTITKYSQNGRFTREKDYVINLFSKDSNISTAVDSINAHYYYTSEDDHLLFEIDGEKIGLIGTKNIHFDDTPTEFDIINAGKIINETTAYITPNNPESARHIPKDSVFLILAKITYAQNDYYYVTAEHLSQKEYILAQDLQVLAKDTKLKGQKMSAIVSNVAVYKYPFKYSEKLKIDDKEFTLTPKTEVICNSKISDSSWNWYEITINSAGKNYTGYVNADYLAKKVPTTPEQNIIFMKTKAPKIGTNIKIYEQADINSEILFDDIKDGEDIQIVGEYNPESTFTKVFYKDKIGYILNENLQANGLTPNQIIAITITSVAIVAFTIIAILFMHKTKMQKKKVENIEPDILA